MSKSSNTSSTRQDFELKKCLEDARDVKELAQTRVNLFDDNNFNNSAQQIRAENAIRRLEDELADLGKLGLPATNPLPTMSREKWEQRFLRAFERLVAICRDFWKDALELQEAVKASSDRYKQKNEANEKLRNWLAKFHEAWREVSELGCCINPRLEASVARDGGSASKTEAPPESSKAPTKPRQLLTGWREIAAKLEMKYADRKKIKSLNAGSEGPIKHKGRGSKPFVYCDELIKWWNSLDARHEQLAARQENLANQQRERKLSAETQHDYGREGKVAPEIGGGVKKRRRKKNKQT